MTGACATGVAEPPPGEVVFQTHCASCHGIGGRGDGPVAESLRVPVPNLRLLNQRYGGEFPADTVASYIDGRDFPDAHGERAMPVWGTVFAATAQIVEGAATPEQRVDGLVDYLRTLQER